MEKKIYTFISTLVFEAESQEEVEQMLHGWLQDDCESSLYWDESWALDPLCEDDF
jgi:hypothetical protein